MPADEQPMNAQAVIKRADGGSILSTDGPVTARTLKEVAVEPDRMDQARRRLEAQGFTVQTGDATSLSIEGPVTQFQAVFGVGPDDVEAEATVPDDLDDIVAGVIVPQAPELFS